MYIFKLYLLYNRTSSTCFYEKGAQYGISKSEVPSIERSRRGTSTFQTPQTGGSLSQEVEEHLRIVGMFQHLAHSQGGN
jgi:hypothetical protein